MADGLQCLVEEGGCGVAKEEFRRINPFDCWVLRIKGRKTTYIYRSLPPWRCTILKEYFIHHCLICRPPDSVVSEDAETEPKTGATSALSNDTVRRYNPQSRQSARLFLLSSEFGQPTPSYRRRVLPPPPLVPGGGGHTCLRERGWADTIRTRGQTLWYSRYI